MNPVLCTHTFQMKTREFHRRPEELDNIILSNFFASQLSEGQWKVLTSSALWRGVLPFNTRKYNPFNQCHRINHGNTDKRLADDRKISALIKSCDKRSVIPYKAWQI